MKIKTMATAGIVTALSVAATGLMMSGTARRVAKNAAETVEETGKKMGRMIKKMK